MQDQKKVNLALENQDEAELKTYRAAQAEDQRMPTANMFMLDWNEDTPDENTNPWRPKSSNTGTDISEDEIGSDNFQRYRNLSQDDQKIARTKYRERLLENNSTKSSSEKRVLLPDGMRGPPVSRFKDQSESWCDVFVKFFIIAVSMAMLSIATKFDYEQMSF